MQMINGTCSKTDDPLHNETDRQTDKQTDRQTDNQSDRQTVPINTVIEQGQEA